MPSDYPAIPTPTYAAPVSITSARRDGMLLVVAPTTDLPTRCIKCNADCCGQPVHRKISTLSAWYPLFLSAGWNEYLADDRPVYITFNLCHKHRLQWLARPALICLGALANIFCLILYLRTPNAGPIVDSIAASLPLLFCVLTLSLRPMIRPRRVRFGLAWLAGAGPEFLDSLPQLSNRLTSQAEL